MAGTIKQREEINIKLVTMQMEMIGKTYQDAMDTPEFWRVYTLTTQQEEEWRKKALPLIKKTFKCNKQKALLTMHFFELNLGLRTYNPPEEEEGQPLPPPPEELFLDPTAYLLEKPTLWQKIKKFFIGF